MPDRIAGCRRPTRLAALMLGAVAALVSFGAAAYQHPIAIPTPDSADAALQAEDAQAEAEQVATAATPNSLGCGLASSHTGEYWATTTDGNRKLRKYFVQLPGDYSRTRAYPLIFVFHGAGGSGSQAFGWGLQNTPAAKNNAIFVFPDGIQY